MCIKITKQDNTTAAVKSTVNKSILKTPYTKKTIHVCIVMLIIERIKISNIKFVEQE